MYILRRSLVPVLALLLAAACGDAPPALTVGELRFTAEETAGLRPADLARLADLGALATAVTSGTVDPLVEPLVRREVERARVLALPEYLGARRLGIPEARLREAYGAAPEWELSVRHVVRLVPRWAGEAERAEARRVAAEAERRARAGEDFAAIAAELSEEPGAAERGGLLQPGREGSWVDPFWQAALALRPGEISPVVETEYGYHVLKLDDRRPLPYEEAARLPVLRRLVPRPVAVAAMEEWVAAQPPVVLDPPAVLAAREALRAGDAPDSLVLARSPAGTPFTARDLSLGWAALGSGEREALRRADDGAFGEWATGEAREAFWAEAAREAGAEPPAGVEAEARARWAQRVEGPGAALGVRPGMTGGQLRAALVRALGSTGQEARIARAEVEAMRPLLRSAYPAEAPALASSPSSSETPSSESTR